MTILFMVAKRTPIQDQAPEQDGQHPHGSPQQAQSPDSKGTETTKAYCGQNDTELSMPPTPTPHGLGRDNQAVNKTDLEGGATKCTPLSPGSGSVDNSVDQKEHGDTQSGYGPGHAHNDERTQLYLMDIEQLGEYLEFLRSRHICCWTRDSPASPGCRCSRRPSPKAQRMSRRSGKRLESTED